MLSGSLFFTRHTLIEELWLQKGEELI